MDVNIFTIPLYYISFDRRKNIENHYRKYGFHNIHHFTAINGRKLIPEELKNQGKITIRTYDDLVAGRRQHSGISSLGAIGCTMSHYALWRLCIDKKMDFIIVTEEDNRLKADIDQKTLEKIMKAIQRPNGIFVSAKKKPYENYKNYFIGTHFYIASKGACENLAKECFPIDIQTDWYIAHIALMKKIWLTIHEISYQDRRTPSTIQDGSWVVIMPKSQYFYYGVISLFILLVILVLRGIKK